jgi:hypothetical protein
MKIKIRALDVRMNKVMKNMEFMEVDRSRVHPMDGNEGYVLILTNCL